MVHEGSVQVTMLSRGNGSLLASPSSGLGGDCSGGGDLVLCGGGRRLVLTP